MIKILLVDDSTLVRRVICDVLAGEKDYIIEDCAKNGSEALELIQKKQYDVILSDVHMPIMNGVELLGEMRKKGITVRTIMVSSLVKEGSKLANEVLQLGAMACVSKPDSFLLLESDKFVSKLIATLKEVVNSPIPKNNYVVKKATSVVNKADNKTKTEITNRKLLGDNIVAIASSTGGPSALKELLGSISQNIDASILIVQHMPVGFTHSFATRLNEQCEVEVKEAEDGEGIRKGCVYLAKGGKHLNVKFESGIHKICYSDEPLREGVKPCANYMYESLADSKFKKIICVVLTGMGSDGTKGITNLKLKKDVEIIAQNEESCVVYAMPKSITIAEKLTKNYSIAEIAEIINMKMGVQ